MLALRPLQRPVNIRHRLTLILCAQLISARLASFPQRDCVSKVVPWATVFPLAGIPQQLNPETQLMLVAANSMPETTARRCIPSHFGNNGRAPISYKSATGSRGGGSQIVPTETVKKSDSYPLARRRQQSRSQFGGARLSRCTVRFFAVGAVY